MSSFDSDINYFKFPIELTEETANVSDICKQLDRKHSFPDSILLDSKHELIRDNHNSRG